MCLHPFSVKKFGITLKPDEDDNEELTCIARRTCRIPLYFRPRNVSMDDAVNVQSTSDQMKKDYANEIMKQQILKICHDNAKMMKELPEMKSLLSSSSTPPVMIFSASPPCQNLIMKIRKTKKTICPLPAKT